MSPRDSIDNMIEETIKAVTEDVWKQMAEAVPRLQWTIGPILDPLIEGKVASISIDGLGLAVKLSSAKVERPVELFIGPKDGGLVVVGLSLGELGVFIAICKRMLQLSVTAEAQWDVKLKEALWDTGGKGH